MGGGSAGSTTTTTAGSTCSSSTRTRDGDIGGWERGGLPRSALFHNVHGQRSRTSAQAPAPTPARRGLRRGRPQRRRPHRPLRDDRADDQLLWNNGDGTFTEGARAAGLVSFGWHSGAAVADVNGDGRPDLFVAGYTD